MIYPTTLNSFLKEVLKSTSFLESMQSSKAEFWQDECLYLEMPELKFCAFIFPIAAWQIFK